MRYPFVNGNKRTGHAAMETFLVLNGYEIEATVDEQERIIGHLLAAGIPQWVLFPLRSTWVVPVQLTYPAQSGDAIRPAPTTAGPQRERDC